MKENDKLTNLLIELGLTNLETKIYIWLLKNNRSTGYKISKTLNKPVANTYKALSSLEKKGAVLCDESTNKKYYNTIPIKKFLNKIENEFQVKRKRIEAEAEKLDSKEISGGIFRLKSAQLVYQKAEELIKDTKNILLLDVMPEPLKRIKSIFKQVNFNKKHFFLKSYLKEKITNCHPITAFNGEAAIDFLDGQWLILVKDSEETLIAYFDKSGEELINSVWINDSFVSFMLFNGSANEFNLIEIMGIIYDEQDNKIERMKKSIKDYQVIYKLMQTKQKDLTKNKENKR